jgi:predicted nucleic acid-binding protein
MPDYLADSSVLLDLLTEDPHWSTWSLRAIQEAWESGDVCIDPIVYAEISVRFSRIEELEEAVSTSGLVWKELPREALFLAGKAFLEYRRSGGTKTSPLPDFFIGAHAAVSNLILVTRDPLRVRRAFPRVRLVCPDSPRD